jgi:enterochelin esterase-like enzyme
MLLAAGALSFAQPRPATEVPELFGFEARVWQGITLSDGQRAGVVVLVPRGISQGERVPLLIAMHGLGETWRGPQRGAWGWVLDYALPRADRALRGGALTADHLEGLVTAPRLSALNRALRAQRYGGMVVLLPFTPDVRGALGGPDHQAYDRWLSEGLIERARRELPVQTTREATGIDGVSLGGLHALWTGLGHPEVFGSVGALQPAVRTRRAAVLARYNGSPSRLAQRIRITTSTRDSLRPDVTGLDADMTRARIAHEFRVLEGPHDYVFNRGPGAVEMLLFHDRALRGLAPP